MLIFRGGNYSIESAQKALENYVYEHAILFDRNDNFYIEISSGDLFEVSFPSKENYRGFTYLHNHPNGTFTSGDDIDLAFRYRLKELQTISLGHIYSLLTSGSFINKPTSPNAAECFTEYWAACYGIDNFDQLSPQQQHDILLPYIAKSRYIHLLK